MATAAQAQEIINDLHEKVARLKEAVQEFTKSSEGGASPTPVVALPREPKANK